MRLAAAKAAFGMPFIVKRLHEKKTTRYQEQDPEKVAAYQEEIKDIPPEKIAYVDECGIDMYLYPGVRVCSARSAGVRADPRSKISAMRDCCRKKGASDHCTSSV